MRPSRPLLLVAALPEPPVRTLLALLPQAPQPGAEAASLAREQALQVPHSPVEPQSCAAWVGRVAFERVQPKTKLRSRYRYLR